MTFNPYDAPAPLQDTGGDSDCWREGNFLVMRHNTHLPLRCVKCNKEVPFRGKERTVYWHHPGLYLLVLLHIFIYLIASLIVRKKARIDPSLCITHANRRSTAIWSAWGLVALSVFTFGVAINKDFAGGWLAIAIVLLLGAFIVAIVGARLLIAKEITDVEVRLKGCGNDFLESLSVKRGF